jgi:hypothetical protein
MDEKKRLYLVFDVNLGGIVSLPLELHSKFLARIGDNKYCALIIRKGKTGFKDAGFQVFIGPADKLEEAKIINSGAIHGHWFIEVEGIFLYYFRKTDGIPDKPYDEYSFSEKDGIFHIIPPEKVFRGMPLF